MENASKALLIAAGILMGLILITMTIYGYNQITSYYKTKEQAAESEQLIAFNKQFIGYNRDDVRGSDLISLVNKIIDYNVDKINYTNDEKIEISIVIPVMADGSHKNFYYKYDTYYGSKKKLINFGESNAFTEQNIYNENGLIDEANKIEALYTQALATKLTTKIATLMDEYKDNRKITKEDLFTELKIDPNNYDGGAGTMQENILKYYQYIQFKRAHFDCTDLTYKNGRVKSFTFEFNGTFE